MTTYYPISFTVPQYEDSSGNPYSGAVLKAYVAGTSTPLALATDYTGATTSATAVLNAAGYPTVSGNVIIPHYSENYKLSLYPTSAAATANTGAIWTVDNNQISQFSTATRLVNQATDTGAADAYVIAPDPAIAAYAVGQIVTLLPVNTNTGASTLTVSGLATKDIKRIDGSALLAGDMLSTGISVLVYNGTSFILTNPKNDVLSDTTIGNASTSMHGYLKKLSNTATEFMNGQGNWTALTNSSLPTGTVVDRAYAAYTATTGLTTALPNDDTIPQNTEGDEILTASITPKSATNRVRITFMGFASAVTGTYLSSALFIDSVADAVQASSAEKATGSTPATIGFSYEYVPGDTSAHTYKVRCGANSGTMYMNSKGATRMFGGIAAATLIVEEIKA